MAFPSLIAIDGPVASGKSVVGKQLAAQLGYLFFDTGVMYRAVTCLALNDLGSADDARAVTDLARRVHIDIQPPTVDDGRDSTVFVVDPLKGTDGADITWAIRSKDVENSVSLVAAMQDVRRLLTEQMRRVGLRGQVVMVGRDVGTVILPEADLKVFLTASVETRARRRFQEMRARGTGDLRTYDDILVNLRERDQIDSSRQIAPLRPADDAIRLDTTDLDVEGVLSAIKHLIAARKT
jgi:cytidylate kinase